MQAILVATYGLWVCRTKTKSILHAMCSRAPRYDAGIPVHLLEKSYRAATNQHQEELNNTLGLATCKPLAKKTTTGKFAISLNCRGCC